MLYFGCFCFFLNFCVYILKSLERGIYFEIQNEKVLYVYMLIRYCMHNILSNVDKNRDVTIKERVES